MFKYLTKGLLAGIVINLLDNCRHLSIQVLKIEAAKCYLHGVRMARLSAIGLMRMGLVIGLIGVGVLLFHAGLFILLPWTAETKAVLGMFLGLAYVAIGCVGFMRPWMRRRGWRSRVSLRCWTKRSVSPTRTHPTAKVLPKAARCVPTGRHEYKFVVSVSERMVRNTSVRDGRHPHDPCGELPWS